MLPPASSLSSIPLLTLPAAQGTTAVTWANPQPISVSLAAAAGNMQLTPSLFQSPVTIPSVVVNPSLDVSLSPATEPFSQKLVDRVRTDQFVEMRDLLTDNIALLQQMDTFTSQYACIPALPGAIKPRLRDVTTLPSWLYCFLAYIAIRSTDQATRDMLAYARLVIREAQRHGGTGWLDYDRVFRQQAAIDATLRWNTLHSGIQAATLVGQTPGVRSMCTLCREPDHTAVSCALAYLQQPTCQPTHTTRTQPPPRPPVRPHYQDSVQSIRTFVHPGTGGGVCTPLGALSGTFAPIARGSTWPRIVAALRQALSTRGTRQTKDKAEARARGQLTQSPSNKA